MAGPAVDIERRVTHHAVTRSAAMVGYGAVEFAAVGTALVRA